MENFLELTLILKMWSRLFLCNIKIEATSLILISSWGTGESMSSIESDSDSD